MAAAALGGLVVVGCDRDDTRTSSTTSSRTTASSTTSTAPAVGVDVDVNKDKLKNMANRTGDAIERGADKTVAVAREAGHDTKEALQSAGQKIGNAADRAGDKASDTAQQAGARGTAAAPDAEGIRDVLAQVAEASLTKGGLDDLVERLVDQDRNRIGQTLQKNNPDLDGRIDQFRKDWQAKYNQDFDIKNEEQAFPNSMFAITQGEQGHNAAGGAVSVDANRNASGGATANVDVKNNTGVDRPDSTAADANRNDPGRNVATIQIQASHGLPALTVPMIHEAPDRWRIDVPNTLTAEKLKANVLAHLTAADEQKDQWPGDVNQAYALVTHHVLMALMDQPVQK
jgi:hypothetical protein